ncbi:MAG: aminotransferase class IV [Bacteroidales bacterium]|jgi:4-amino-4-deoxychorismate lyase|nr:aminotransferase class IV [Bacteroidales bacterium]
MSQFIESIRINDGNIDLLDYHNERFNATRKLFFCVDDEWDLEHFIQIPEVYKKGLVKCRIVYDIGIREMKFSYYKHQNIKHIKLAKASINYEYKYTDRSQLEQLKVSVLPADEVLIVNNGKISDTSFSNIIFLKKGNWYTPDSPLLAGVRREQLLNEGIIEELEIKPAELINFEAFMLINALLDFDENRALPIENIIDL